MSYQVLARKWRPSSLKDLVGQSAVVRILTNALKADRLHPALIFAGPRGTGKTSTARILAKNLSCPHIKNLSPCNNCKTCQDIDESRSLDVMEIDGASNNGVEAVRQLKETITYLPTGPYKIYIIDEVHMLSLSAFNALLKTLEEPPPHAVFIMATTEMRKIPPTVLSRCQILQFRQITDDLIYEQLKKISQEEKVQTEESALWILARSAQGSLRDAQGLLDQMITFCHKKFESKDISEILGLTDRSLLMKTVKSLLNRNPNGILEVLGPLQEKGEDPALFLQNLIKELRHLLLLKFSPSHSIKSHSIKSLVPLSQEEKTQLSKWVSSVSSEDLHFLLDMSLKGSWDMSRIEDTKVFLEILLLKMSQAPYIEALFPVEKAPPPSTKQEGKQSRQKVPEEEKTKEKTNKPAKAYKKEALSEKQKQLITKNLEKNPGKKPEKNLENNLEKNPGKPLKKEISSSYEKPDTRKTYLSADFSPAQSKVEKFSKEKASMAKPTDKPIEKFSKEKASMTKPAEKFSKEKPSMAKPAEKAFMEQASMTKPAEKPAEKADIQQNNLVKEVQSIFSAIILKTKDH